MTKEERRLKELRADVRASLARMDTTPADPKAMARAEQRNADLWEQFEARPKDWSRREHINGVSDVHGNSASVQAEDDEDEAFEVPKKYGAITALKSFGVVTMQNGEMFFTWNDGERGPLEDSIDYLTKLIADDLQRQIKPGQVRLAAKRAVKL
ncbi:hypothetical protein CUW27_20795 [Salmonella enterica]|nr:hypothetical protein [Salmonella enterica]